MIIAKKPKISLSIKAHDTTNIHRGGMAGLWMTLKQLEKAYPLPTQRPGNLNWDLTNTQIALDWRREASPLEQGNDFPVLDWLIQQSFKIDRQGLISFTGLQFSLHKLSSQIHIHQAINDTFLRHNKFYTKKKITSKLLNIARKPITLEYKALNWYVHQTFAEKLCDESGYLIDGYIKIVSWLYPGATVRHARLNEVTKIEEKVEYAFALLFLPLVCQYFILHSDSIKSDRRSPNKYAIVIPEVNSLAATATRCWQLGKSN